MFARKRSSHLQHSQRSAPPRSHPRARRPGEHWGAAIGVVTGRSLGPLGWLGLGPPLGRRGLGRMGLAGWHGGYCAWHRCGVAYPVTTTAAPMWRFQPAALHPPAHTRPAAARSWLPRQRIYARWQCGVHRPLHPGERGCSSEPQPGGSPQDPPQGGPPLSTLKRPNAHTHSVVSCANRIMATETASADGLSAGAVSPGFVW
jgi:hypothetical protein